MSQHMASSRVVNASTG